MAFVKILNNWFLIISAPDNNPSTQNVTKVQESVDQSQSRCLQRGAKNLDSVFSIRRILIHDLKLYHCWIRIKHQLNQANLEKRVAMCHWFSQKINDNEEFLNEVRFLVEPTSFWKVRLTPRTRSFGGSKNLYRLVRRFLHSKKCKECFGKLSLVSWLLSVFIIGSPY